MSLLPRLLLHSVSITLIATMPVSAAWKDAPEKDQLTGKIVAMQELAASAPVHQFGRSVGVRLIIRCDNNYNDREKFKSEDYYAVFLLFSQQVGIGDVLVRYSFDGGTPTSRTFSLQGRGRAIFLSPFAETHDFEQSLRTASKLRLQADLPWAGTPVFEFDTRGAADAFNRVPCGE